MCSEAPKTLKQREGQRHGWMSDSLMKEAKQEGNYTPLSLLCFTLAPPSPFTALSSLVRTCAPRYSSSNYLKKDILFTFGPFSSSACPAGKFYLSDQTSSRSAQHSNSLPSLLRKLFCVCCLNIKGMTVTPREKE